MMKQYLLLLVIISITTLFSSVYCATDDNCTVQSNQGCSACVNVPSCAYCTTSKVCFTYHVGDTFELPCAISDLQYQTCIGSFRTWIIVISVLAGVLVFAIIIAICCVCYKCKRRSIRKEESRQQRDDQRMAEQTQERQTVAEARTAERARIADNIRMKYGMLKDKDNATDYSRMP